LYLFLICSIFDNGLYIRCDLSVDLWFYFIQTFVNNFITSLELIFEKACLNFVDAWILLNADDPARNHVFFVLRFLALFGIEDGIEGFGPCEVGAPPHDARY
jgi:hypothetical protein